MLYLALTGSRAGPAVEFGAYHPVYNLFPRYVPSVSLPLLFLLLTHSPSFR